VLTNLVFRAKNCQELMPDSLCPVWLPKLRRREVGTQQIRLLGLHAVGDHSVKTDKFNRSSHDSPCRPERSYLNTTSDIRELKKQMFAPAHRTK